MLDRVVDHCLVLASTAISEVERSRRSVSQRSPMHRPAGWQASLGGYPRLREVMEKAASDGILNTRGFNDRGR